MLKIAGPLYDLGRVKALASSVQALTIVTRKCRRDIANLFGSNHQDVADLICSLNQSDYHDSEWCEVSPKSLAACDAYRVKRREYDLRTDQTLSINYYVKFAIGRGGKLLLLVSTHLSS
ncbi:type II toxin-antitoxin system MqsR family toxin [Achromobacter sp. GG226]|nr:type II toxin-antitoxin system MqsR family toxin [Verticiella sp. GG226]